MNRVIEDDIGAVDADLYLMTHTTNPLLSTDTINRAVATFKELSANNSCDSLFSVNVHHARFYRANGTPINHDPNDLIRTQDLEPAFEEPEPLSVHARELR